MHRVAEKILADYQLLSPEMLCIRAVCPVVGVARSVLAAVRLVVERLSVLM
jgi:hypothetical protein